MADWLRYANQGATRNQPVSDQLVQALSFLPELGVRMEVFSGGQPGAGEGGGRVGSTRHDHGNAADVRFYDASGRMLNWENPQDVPIFEEIVRRAVSRGVTGIGAGPGYMSPGTMHIGFGAPAVWGAGGSSANAPQWLRSAYGAGPSSSATASPATPAPAAPRPSASHHIAPEAPQNALAQAPPEYRNNLAGPMYRLPRHQNALAPITVGNLFPGA